MFTPERRDRLRSELLEYAARDSRISGAAVTGSAAEGRQDRWSDVDLAFGIRDGSVLQDVLAEWTAHMYDRHQAAHHLDVRAGEWIYRVFLLPCTLQVDLAFVAAREFRPLAPTFHLVFGHANELSEIVPPRPEDIAGLAWLHALHARSCIARRRFWQAEYMISGVRSNALALACIRHGLPAAHGRGMDLLPDEVTAQFEGSLVRELDAVELTRAFRVVVQGLLGEIRRTDEELGRRLQDPLMRLAESVSQKERAADRLPDSQPGNEAG